MDDIQRKRIQLQLIIFCAFGFPCALISFIMYSSIQVLVFVGIASFMIAGISLDVLDYCKGEEAFQSHPEAGDRSSRDHASDDFYQQDDINDQSRFAEGFRDYYEQDQFGEVQPEYSEKSYRTVQPQHPVQLRRTAQLQRPVPPRRSAPIRSTWS